MLLTKYEKQDLPDTEPMFELYKKDRKEISNNSEDFRKDDINTGDLVPDERIRGYNNMIEFLESSNDSYIWAEIGSTRKRTLCEECDNTIYTNSKERLHELRSTHRKSTGQHFKLPENN